MFSHQCLYPRYVFPHLGELIRLAELTGCALHAQVELLLAQAEQLLAPEPVRALHIVREGQVTFRNGYFAQERRYIELMALFALGRDGEAHAHAEWFLRDYPTGPYRTRVELEVLRHPSR